jgi:hypothetical protein
LAISCEETTIGGNCLKSPTTIALLSIILAATHIAGIGAIDASSTIIVSYLLALMESFR